MPVDQIPNFINGEWKNSAAAEFLDIRNPATAETIARMPLSLTAETGQVVAAADRAYQEWRLVPVTERIQYLFRLKHLLEADLEDLARTITLECGKTLDESRGELRRGIENVETACGIPALMQGQISQDIARGIDEMMIRQPLGVVCAITPFNFPAMIPLWFLPYAIACGNTFILKPSDRTPLTMRKIFGLLEKTGIPKGVASLINGGRQVVEALVDHPKISAVSLVGSTAVAKAVYARAAANGKRAQCQGGAKNPIVVLPDADMEMVAKIAADSSFGCAGQRCLAASLAVTVGEAKKTFTRAFVDMAKSRKVGYGLDQGVEMGPVITAESRSRVASLIERGAKDGGKLMLDGRGVKVKGYEKGYFLGPTILQDLPPESEAAQTEIFGPVVAVISVPKIEEAIALINRGRYGNMACLFTTNGSAARKFRSEVETGNVGINLGVAAPIAFFPFSGWKESFFGDLHAQGRHAVEFYTQTKVVIERWPKEWTRKF
ncbi:MAG: CoA-acylating methylmalonate-semialdehyde dehydrogenase [Elusimicrobia bacterium]|nr:CoA-acylating methylmalonate-semialdehyde dehydrogenase [Elusimicrobiota bacterium]